MKKILTSNVLDPSQLQPFTAQSLRFLQESKEDDVAAIIKSIVTQNIGSYSLTVPYVISGCVVSDSGKDVTAGEVFYGGKYYETTAVNGTTNIARFILTASQDSTADPLTFSNSSVFNVHTIYKYVATDVASGGDFTSANLVSAYGSGKIAEQKLLATTTQSTSIPTYVDLGGITYTNTTGVSKKFKLTLKGVLEMSAVAAVGSSGCAGKVKLINSTTSIDLDICKFNVSSIVVGQTVDIFAHIPFSCQTIVTLANNDEVKGQFVDDADGVTITDVKFLIEEM